MRSPLRHLFSVALLGLASATLLAAVEACNETAEGASACDGLCSGVDDCNGASCMAVCVAAQTACNDKGQDGAFQNFVSSQPGLVCTQGSGYSLSALSEIALIPCDVRVGTATASSSSKGKGDGGGVVIVGEKKDSGTTKGGGDDSGTVSVGTYDAGFDAGTCVTNGCPEGYTCQGDEGEDECVPDEGVDAGDDAGCTSDGSCSASCVDNCGNSCTGGQCESSECVSTGCTACNATNGECSTLGTCADNCGNECCL
jgi:hypothetical protein